MLLIQDPETSIVVNLDTAEWFEEGASNRMIVRLPGTRLVAIHEMSYTLLEHYNTESNGRIKLHTLEPLNFKFR